MACPMHDLYAGALRKPRIGETVAFAGTHGYRGTIERRTQRRYRLTLERPRVCRFVSTVTWWETWHAFLDWFPNHALFTERSKRGRT